MKFGRLNSWLGVVSNIAIVLGLVALVIEIRANTQAVRSQEISQGEAFERQRQLLLATDPVLTPIYMKSLYEPSALTLEEIHRVTYYLVSRVDTLRRCYQTFNDEVTTREDWEDCRHFAPMYLGSQFGRVWWDLVKETDYNQDPDFVADVDRAEGALGQRPQGVVVDLLGAQLRALVEQHPPVG